MLIKSILFSLIRRSHAKWHLLIVQDQKYDGFDVKIKELAAFGVYTLLLPYWKKKRVWLVFEKFCSMAQDNGYYFFKYCMEQLPKEKKQHIYYILDTDSADYDKMKQYGKHVIPFMSFRHILYSLVANLYIASDSKKHFIYMESKTKCDLKSYFKT